MAVSIVRPLIKVDLYCRLTSNQGVIVCTYSFLSILLRYEGSTDKMSNSMMFDKDCAKVGISSKTRIAEIGR